MEKDIENGCASILKVDEEIVATGCFVENHITRAYVLPEYQKKRSHRRTHMTERLVDISHHTYCTKKVQIIGDLAVKNQYI